MESVDHWIQNGRSSARVTIPGVSGHAICCAVCSPRRIADIPPCSGHPPMMISQGSDVSESSVSSNVAS
jgi:hypothetical protein